MIGRIIIRRWATAASIAWFLLSGLLASSQQYIITPWPATSAVLFFAAAASLVVLAVHPGSRRTLDVAAVLGMMSVLYRAMGILLSGSPLELSSSEWIGVIVYISLAWTIGFLGTVFRIIQDVGVDQ